MIKRLKKNIKETKPAVDAHKTILFPLDYSFKAISEFSGESIINYTHKLTLMCTEVLFEKPRGRDAKFTGVRFYYMQLLIYNVYACSRLKMKWLVMRIN